MNPGASRDGRSIRHGLSGRAVAVGALLVLLCLAVYVPGLGNEFVWDDELFVSRNPAVSGGLSAASLRWAFTTFHTGIWHPLTWISHLLDTELFGLEPAGHHLTSLLLHTASALLIFLLFWRLTGALWRSALVAALFAVHPLHVESVAWVAERKDVLSTSLMLLALLAWLGWLQRPRAGRFAAAAAIYALALLAKPMPVTFPFLLLLLDWWPLGRFVPGRRAAVAAEKLPFFALAALCAAITYQAQSSVDAVGSVPALVRLANVFQSYCRYIIKTLWPTRLALLYPFPTTAPSLAATVLAVAALAFVTLLVLRVRRRAPALAVGWLWYLGTLVPVIGIIQVGTQAMADRYAYVPLTGLFVMGVWGIGPSVWQGRKRTRWLAAGAVAVVALLTAVARHQVGLWRDPLTAFSNAIQVTRDNRVAHCNLGVYHADRGDNRLAEVEFRAAIAIADDYADAHGGLAQLLEKEGRVGEAIAEYRAALRADPRLAEASNNLGALLALSGPRSEAESSLRRALQLRPDFAAAHSNLGRLLARRDRIDEALEHFREAARLSPGTAGYHGDLGAALAARGELDAALASLREALRLDPGLETARENLARALSGQARRR